MPTEAHSYRIVLLTADRPADVDTLQDAILAEAERFGATRATMEVTADPACLGAVGEVGSPSTAVVVVGSGQDTQGSAAIAQAVHDARQRFAVVLPVFDPAGPKFESQVPASLHAINGLPWRPGDDVSTVASTVLRLVGLAESDRRVFLSYRRTDGSALANQLRYALTDRGWDVFLDKFSVPPAADFQERLDRELADKAFVLLLETPKAIESGWVEHEVAFALRARLGLLAVASPDTPKRALFGAVPPEFRLALRAADVEGAPHLRVLTDAALTGVLAEADRRHASAYTFRREALMYEASDEMLRSGYRVEPVGQWSLLAERANDREVILGTARAPEPSDIREVDALRRRFRKPGYRTRGWIVHPIEDIDARRASLLSWLCARRQVRPSPVMALSGRVVP